MREPDFFATTCWTAVVAAGGENATQAREALNALCQTYWYPLYAYVRRRGYSAHDAEDLTQGFFARLLRLESLAELRQGEGKFRAFLLASINHHIADEWDKRSAAKRDATRTISLDAELAERRYLHAPVDHLTPEVVFQRQWAITLLEAILQQLKQEYEAAGKAELFERLKPGLTGEKARDGANDGATRVAAHRLRRRYKELLHTEIMRTVGRESDAESELAELRRVLSQ